EIIGDEAAIAVERLLPIDVGRSVPLIDLGLLVEPPHIAMLAIVIVAEIRGVVGLDVMTAFHAILRGRRRHHNTFSAHLWRRRVDMNAPRRGSSGGGGLRFPSNVRGAGRLNRSCRKERGPRHKHFTRKAMIPAIPRKTAAPSSIIDERLTRLLLR